VKLHIAAIVSVRDEQYHIARCLDAFVQDGIDVILIDNDCQDRTIDIARSYLGRGLLSIRRKPWHGVYSQGEILALKNLVAQEIDHDWIINADADEWLCPPAPESSLAAAIRRVDAEGFNCINFDEMVFVALGNEDFTKGDCTRQMINYYFFEPNAPRLMRAWRRDLNASNVESGGHIVSAEGLNLYPTSFVLRHYMALSVEHAAAKYVGRKFSPAELARGWHGQRASIKQSDLVLNTSPYLKRLARWDSQDFDRSTPAKTHYWLWAKQQS
jgi:glycosyltransferase involved in cell wall biosynthesis